jgi:hypothetical protein
MNKQIIELDNGTFKVLNSKGTDYYLINRAGHCSCKGHGYRKKCRHIDLLKKKGLLDKDSVVKREKEAGYAGTKLVPKFVYRKGMLFRVEFVPA